MSESKPRRKYLLRDLEVTRVDHVGQGANQYADIVLFKGADRDRLNEILRGLAPAIGSRPSSRPLSEPAPAPLQPTRKKMDATELLEIITKDLVAEQVFTSDTTVEDFVSILSDETLEAFTKIDSSAEGSAVPEEEHMPLPEREIETGDLPEKVVEYITELEEATLSLAKRLDDKDAELAELIAKADEEPEAPADDEDAIYKGLSPELVAVIKADREELAKAKEDLAKERRERVRKEYVTKAAQYDGIVDDFNAFAEVLMAIDEAVPEAGAEIAKVLTTATARIEAGDLFKEAGTNVGEGGDAWDKATNIAKGLVDGEKFNSIEAARAQVWEDNPDLYAQYQAERRASR